MRRLITAPNLAIATLWADMLTQGGFEASVQRAYASSIAGEVPPDQCLPEVWVMDETQYDAARTLLDQLRRGTNASTRQQRSGTGRSGDNGGEARPPISAKGEA